MALTMRTTQGVGRHQGVKSLVFGGAGAGKTTLMATAMGYSPIILSAESGLLSLSNYNIPFFDINTIADFEEAYKWLAFSQESLQFGLVGCDSISEIAEVLLTKLKASAKDPRQAYGDVVTDCVALLRKLRDLPGRNVLVTAKMEYIKGEGLALPKYQPSMPGSKLGAALPYLFDEVFFLGISQPDAQGKTFRYLQTCATMDKDCKDRSGLLAAYEAPDMGYILNKILGYQQ